MKGNGGTTGNPVFDAGSFLRVGETELEWVSSIMIGWQFDGNGESNTATGDSGGPAFVERDGELLIAGVTSGGTQDDWWNPGDDSFDTRVEAFADWIDSIIGVPVLG